MRIPILQFRVTETYTMKVVWWRKILNLIHNLHDPDQYHFDLLIKIDGYHQLENEFIELPNKVRLKVWHVEREMVKAKTYKFVTEDLRQYRPMEMYLVYPKRKVV